METLIGVLLGCVAVGGIVGLCMYSGQLALWAQPFTDPLTGRVDVPTFVTDEDLVESKFMITDDGILKIHQNYHPSHDERVEWLQWASRIKEAKDREKRFRQWCSRLDLCTEADGVLEQ